MSERQRYGMTRSDYQKSLPFQTEDKGIDISKEPYGQVVVRVVSGGVRHDQVWYPVIRETRDDGYKKSWSAVNVDGTHENFFTALAAADLAVKRQHLAPNADPSKLRSQFDHSTKFLYLVIPRVWSGMKNEDKLACVMRVPWKVHKGIQDLQTEPHPTKAGTLLDGPVCMYDVVIKIIDKGENKPVKYRRDYDVVSLENKWAGKCPNDWTDDGLPGDFDVVEQKVFTPEEKEEIDSLIENGILEEITCPATHSQIAIQLDKTRLNIFARRDGALVFEYPDELAKRLETLAVPLLTEDQVTKLLNDIPGQVHGDTETKMPEGGIQEGDVVDDGKPDPKPQPITEEPVTEKKKQAAVKF